MVRVAASGQTCSGWATSSLRVPSTAEAPDAEGRQRTVEHSELWSLDADGRLVVEYAERRSGVAVVSTSLIYKKR